MDSAEPAVEPPSGLIAVDVTRTITQQADRADLLVTVSGSSLVTGRAALRQAREVAELVQAARAAGLDDEDVELLQVHAQPAGSRLGRASATYQLRLRCRDLDRLPDVLGAVTAQRTNRLDQIEWGYPDAEEARDEAIREAVGLLRRRAAVTAEAMGVTVLGVHVLRVHTPDLPGQPIPRTRMAMASQPESVDLGMDITNSRTLSVTVSGELRVAPAG